MKKIFIYGTGYYGLEVYRNVKNKFNVIGFLDSDKKKINKKKINKKIYSLEILKRKNFDKVFIASMWSSDIYKKLILNKIPKTKIYVFPISSVHRNKKRKKKWFSTFKELINIFNKNKICYHLDHSSLLGLVRDKDIYSSDIDIAIKYSQLKLIKKLLVKSRKFKKIEYGLIDVNKMGFGKQFTYQLTVDKFIDLQVKKKIKQNYFWLIGSNILKCNQKYFINTKNVKFKNILINVPVSFKNYLANLYGKLWKKPQSNWTYDNYNNIHSKIRFANYKRKRI